ncbi:MAG: ABC transporter permease [Vagococcus sp.]
MRALIEIELIRMWRDKKTFIMSTGMPIFFYVMLTRIIEVPEGYRDTFYIEYLMSMTVFSMTSFALFMFPFEIIQDKKNGWRKRLFHVDISSVEVYTVKIIKMVCLYTTAILGVFLAGRVLNNIHLTSIQWLVSGLILLFGGITFLSLGLVISHFEEEKTASACSNILYLGMALLGGLWVPTDVFPTWLQPISRAMPTYQFRELAVGYIRDGKIPLLSIASLLAYSGLFLIMSYALSNFKKADVLS